MVIKKLSSFFSSQVQPSQVFSFRWYDIVKIIIFFLLSEMGAVAQEQSQEGDKNMTTITSENYTCFLKKEAQQDPFNYFEEQVNSIIRIGKPGYYDYCNLKKPGGSIPVSFLNIKNREDYYRWTKESCSLENTNHVDPLLKSNILSFKTREQSDQASSEQAEFNTTTELEKAGFILFSSCIIGSYVSAYIGGNQGAAHQMNRHPRADIDNPHTTLNLDNLRTIKDMILSSDDRFINRAPNEIYGPGLENHRRVNSQSSGILYHQYPYDSDISSAINQINALVTKSDEGGQRSFVREQSINNRFHSSDHMVSREGLFDSLTSELDHHSEISKLESASGEDNKTYISNRPKRNSSWQSYCSDESRFQNKDELQTVYSASEPPHGESEQSDHAHEHSSNHSNKNLLFLSGGCVIGGFLSAATILSWMHDRENSHQPISPNDPVSNPPGVIPGVDPGLTPGVIPGVIANFTPGIDGVRPPPMDAAVQGPGFIPGSYSRNHPRKR